MLPPMRSTRPLGGEKKSAIIRSSHGIKWFVFGGGVFAIIVFSAGVGWRYFKYDYVSGGFTNKTASNGPFVQGGVNF